VSMKAICSIFLFLIAVAGGHADDANQYIARFSHIAQEHCITYRIPASITLAQGLLESQFGRSPLATEANNHFGIKCGSNWNDGTFLHDDDRAQECFRSYDTPEESYEDHARFLMRRRYATLFDFDPTDYKAWAFGLKKCGYATDPKYADKLIDIIERYELHRFDIAVEASDEFYTMLEEIMKEDMEQHIIRQRNGIYYVVANQGDTFRSIADELGMKEKMLRAFNSASKKDTLKPGDIVYLQKPEK